MPLRDLLKKKEKVEQKQQARDVPSRDSGIEPPVFTFMRSDTHTQEVIRPPSIGSHGSSGPPSINDGPTESKTSRLFGGRSRSASVNSQASASSRTSERPKTTKRLSQRLHLKRSEPTSESVPQDLPEIQAVPEGEEGRETQWEKRATILARKNEETRSRPVTPSGSTADLGSFQDLSIGREAVVSTRQADDNIQEAIRLHEAGDLKTSTGMFGRLADPNGENNALSQVLYGLALRYVHLVVYVHLCHFSRGRVWLSYHHEGLRPRLSPIMERF